jgi:hypothetical protein
VIAGHVDSRTGPAVFYRLRELRPGDRVEVERADGVRLRFAVEGRAQYHKATLPTDAVFGPVPWPALRLVTCAGSFDRARGSYRDNLVVYARLVAASRWGRSGAQERSRNPADGWPRRAERYAAERGPGAQGSQAATR